MQTTKKKQQKKKKNRNDSMYVLSIQKLSRTKSTDLFESVSKNKNILELAFR